MILATPPSPPHATTNPSIITTSRTHFLHLLTQCATLSHLKQLHAYTLRTTPPHHPDTLFFHTQILQFASSKHDLTYTINLFNQIHNPNAFAYNTLIRGYAYSIDQKVQAFELFKKMLFDPNVQPDKHTFPFVLKACAYLFALSQGKQVHTHVLKGGVASDMYINNSLIHFYLSCGCFTDAKEVFDKMVERNVVSYNAMIDGLVQLNEFSEGLELFREMENVHEPDCYTMQSVICACGGLGALDMGMWAHAYVLRKCKYDEKMGTLLDNCLIDMYCKCGFLDMGVQVFDRMSRRDVNSWNAMILGYAMHGEVGAALNCFDKMVNQDGFLPNSITFVGVLSACNHRGLVHEGRRYFNRMVSEFKISPVLEHYGCLVDLLARAGRIDDALDVVANMPLKPDVVIWRSLLDGLCKKNTGVELSEEVARHIIESEGNVSSGVYVILSRVYACANRWNEVGLIRKLMTDKGITKEPGCSLIEIDGVGHEFFAGDTSHPRRKEIYVLLEVIEERLKLAGYVPDVTQAPLVDEIDDGKGQTLRLHSERLAIAFGLLNAKPGVSIRVFKNLRICGDCHNVIKLISKVFDVDIIVRDRVRFHHFRDGSCSCMDYW